MQNSKRAFTLVELLAVVLIVAILAAIMMPLLSGRIEKAKWSEANAGAGIEKPLQAQTLTGTLDTAAIQAVLGFNPQDLAGSYFVPGDYNIDSVNAQGIAVITVTGGSLANSPAGSYSLAANGSWQKN